MDWQALKTSGLRADCDDDWQEIAANWDVRAGTTYLNHGSFGLPPKAVKHARRQWIDRLDEQPMDFYVRHLEDLVLATRQKLSNFVGTAAENLVLVDNATYGMNVVADSFPLNAGDQVLLNDHEYGAVHRIWQRACARVGAEVVVAKLPGQFETAGEVVESLMAGVSEKTKILIVSHITSPTAVTLPVKKVCVAAQARGVAVCVDGPHAPAQLDVNIEDIGCDFYTASCHKWLCATLGTGFLFAAPPWQGKIEPLNKSWGRLLPKMPEHWTDEFTWSGTRDISAFLSISTAIDFMSEIGLELFRKRSHWLAQYARYRLEEQFKTQAIMPDDARWYLSMAHVPLPIGNTVNYSGLQEHLWREFGIEVPVIEFNDRWFIRVSCHLYNAADQIDYLGDCLKTCLSG